MFSVIDSQGRIGGTEAITVVQLSDDFSCLSGSSPTTSSGISAGTSTLDPAEASARSSHTSVSLSQGAIAGIAVGGTAVLALIAFVLILLLRRRRQNTWRGPTKESVDLTYDPASRHDGRDLNTRSLGLPATYASTPFRHSTSDYGHGLPPPSVSSITHYPSVASESKSSLSLGGHRPLQLETADSTSYYLPNMGTGSIASSSISGSSGYAHGSKQSNGHYQRPLQLINSTTPFASKLAGDPQLPVDGSSAYYTPRRVVVHQDIEESVAPPLELPPQYSDRRLPLAELSSLSLHGGNQPGMFRNETL